MALKNLIEPVSWNYFQKFDQQFRHSAVWDIYPQYFSHLWAASAFKGGLHRYSISTNTTHHVLNNLQWLYFLQSSKFRQESFSAIILTGWSRFDHFMPLCDLLPTAYSSLVYSLHVLSTNEVLFDENIQQCDDIVKSLDRSWQLCELLPGNNSRIGSMKDFICLTRSIDLVEYIIIIQSSHTNWSTFKTSIYSCTGLQSSSFIYSSI